MKKIYALILIACAGILSVHCSVFVSPSRSGSVFIPFFKNSPNECYYLDEFMPVPDGLVKGKSGTLNIRYYTYKNANYKDWQGRYIILAFYSQDERCWSLFEEYYEREIVP